MTPSFKATTVAALALSLAFAGSAFPASATSVAAPHAIGAPTIDAPAAPGAFLVGRGIADTTGEVAESPLFGYFRPDQVANGLHDRLRSGHASSRILRPASASCW